LYRVQLTEDQRAELQARTRAPGVMPRTRDRLEMVRLSDAGWSIPKIAQHLRISEVRVRFWIKRYLLEGFDGLPDQPHPGQPSSLTPELVEALRQEFAKEDRTWTAGQLSDWLDERILSIIRGSRSLGTRFRPARRIFSAAAAEDSLVLDDFDPSSIADPALRRICEALLNQMEAVLAENGALREKIRRLEDEIRRLKGQPGRPKFPAAGSARPLLNPVQDHSSEAERAAREPRPPRKKRTKLDRIMVDRTVTLRPELGTLPPDAQFKGYEDVIVQDLIVKTDNVRFRRAKFYSPTTRKTYLAPLPPGYAGQFGPGIKTLTLGFAYETHVSLPQIHRFLTQAGALISRGQVARLVTEEQQAFHSEAAAVLKAGLCSSPWQHFDFTGTRVDGKNQACHVLGNPLYTSYTTLPGQDRRSVLDGLRGGAARAYRLDRTAVACLEAAGVARQVCARLAALAEERTWNEPDFLRFLDLRLPRLGKEQRKQVLDAAAVAAYQADDTWPVVTCLITDDAAQLRGLTPELALCWVHDGRHYQKLQPVVSCHRAVLNRFRKRYWDFYRELLTYRDAPSPAEAARLEAVFDRLFAAETPYADLATCIARTRANKEKLLRVLVHPELPLHNNPAELAARRRVRKRDVSFGPRSAAGVKAWDTFQSLAATTGKLGIRFYEYLRDRITGAGQIAPLAEVIADRAATLNLGWSWESS
jgi:hypothetical protein